ncbi:glucokinase [Roseateles oligotrophus]|uniref:Glucokinase n=1 Tax=Roseateles oligotrophus TaxID=1769250 RepID=A0ABT2YK71_9BURK|nr:glucokinase [Roseateles oligotrophus]MCV2370458.1 glucokinase [Roseateles oligotrophus]
MNLPSTAAGYPRLLADVGGTNVRFASQFIANGPLQQTGVYACADFESLCDAICHHLWREGLGRPRSGAIGIATPITGDHVRMTNHRWTFSIKAMQEALGLQRLLVLNDFSALALALPTLHADARCQVGGGVAVAGAPIALIGPGTGLGVSGLLPSIDGGGLVPLGGEGGHVTLSSCDPEEQAVLNILHRRFGHVSAERALSGPGLENLYLALAQVQGHKVEALQAQQVTAAALARSDRIADGALDLFCSLLGGAAGNLALTLGARGGVYIGGGIVPRLGLRFAESKFRQSFEAKGRFRAYLSEIPSYVVQASEQAALQGACRALDVGMPH